MSNRDFVLKDELCETVFVIGSTRSGKIILSRILSSLERTNKIEVDYLSEHFPALEKMGHISEDACKVLLRYAIYLKIYNNFLGREMNLKLSDYTSIWNNPKVSENIEKLFGGEVLNNDGKYTNDPKDIYEKIKSKNSIFHLMVHYELNHIFTYLNAFPTAKFIYMKRHPVDLIHSWIKKGYNEEIWSHYNVSCPIYIYDNQNVPYYAYGWEDEFLKLNSIEKIVHIICKQSQISNEYEKNISHDNKKRIMKIEFDEIVQEPDINVKNICSFLKTETTDDTKDIFHKENIPRVLDLKRREEKYEFLIKEISSNTKDFLDQTLTKFKKMSTDTESL